MQVVLNRAKSKRKYSKQGKVQISVGTTKVTYYLPHEQALRLAKMNGLRISAADALGTTKSRVAAKVRSRSLPERGDKLRQTKIRARRALEGSSEDQIQYVKALKEAEGGAWSSAEYEKIAEISRQALKQRRDNFSIVYWTDAKGHCWYPKWQFDRNSQVLPEVRESLELLRTHDTYQVLTTFLVPAVGDGGESPLHLIQSGHGAEAVEFVRALVNEH